MPTLPLIDLLILVASGSLFLGLVEKIIWITTTSRLKLVGLAPMDFLLVAAVCFLMALTLAARTWVKANEPRLLRSTRRDQGEGFISPWEPRDDEVEPASAAVASPKPRRESRPAEPMPAQVAGGAAQPAGAEE